MTVSIEVTARSVKDAVVVPSPAVFKNAEGGYYVLVAGSDKKAHQKVIQLGVKNTELTQVTSGINAGDPVIVSGGYGVPDGTAIESEKPAAKEEEKHSQTQPDKEKE